jgi:hypothetical protein
MHFFFIMPGFYRIRAGKAAQAQVKACILVLTGQMLSVYNSKCSLNKELST